MKILAIDISGRLFRYNDVLYKSIVKHITNEDSLVFSSPYYCIFSHSNPLKLHNIVPKQYQRTSHLYKKILKVIEGLINYIRVARYIKKEHVDILHLQWLPFLEFCNIERFWLRYIKRSNPKIRIILTMHNIYPHNFSEQKKFAYRKRIIKISPLLDSWIVHTNDAKERIFQEYNINKSLIHVVHHGVFTPETPVPERHRNEDQVRFLLFANQSRYKGTDLLIQAVELLPSRVRENIEVYILGSTESSLYTTYHQRAEKVGIIWKNQFISESELLQAIQDADVLVYPYRTITQSGALLLGLYFQKPMLVSNLPAFVETLGDSYPKSLIFNADDAQSLANALTQFSIEELNLDELSSVLAQIVKNNSWDSAAIKTISLYKSFA